MSATYEKISGNKAKLSFTVPAAQFEEAMQKAYLKNRGKINVPGFRRGKAPRKLIETMYGEGVFYDDAFQEIFPNLYDEAVKERRAACIRGDQRIPARIPCPQREQPSFASPSATHLLI